MVVYILQRLSQSKYSIHGSENRSGLLNVGLSLASLGAEIGEVSIYNGRCVSILDMASKFCSSLHQYSSAEVRRMALMDQGAQFGPMGAMKMRKAY